MSMFISSLSLLEDLNMDMGMGHDQSEGGMKMGHDQSGTKMNAGRRIANDWKT